MRCRRQWRSSIPPKRQHSAPAGSSANARCIRGIRASRATPFASPWREAAPHAGPSFIGASSARSWRRWKRTNAACPRRRVKKQGGDLPPLTSAWKCPVTRRCIRVHRGSFPRQSQAVADKRTLSAGRCNDMSAVNRANGASPRSLPHPRRMRRKPLVCVAPDRGRCPCIAWAVGARVSAALVS
jgi:hypothetical protein